MAILKIRNENGEVIEIPALRGPEGKQGPVGPEGPQGVSGVYTGSGEMPEGYDVQIDPNGDDYILCDPIEKTDDMTTPVGMDGDGKLWTMPGNIEGCLKYKGTYNPEQRPLPSQGNSTGDLYILSGSVYGESASKAMFWNGESWSSFSDSVESIIDISSMNVSFRAPTCKAVYDFVSAELTKEIGNINSILATLVDGGVE